MGFFNWAAPMFGHFADRWSSDDIDEIVGWIEPFLREERRILDVGGGTGALARHLSKAATARVTVLDPTPEMLRYLPPDAGVHGVVGTAEAMPFEDAAFDVVIVTDAFHHFRDQAGAVAEFGRVVHPGGGVVVIELDPRGPVMRAIVAGERLLGEPGAFFTPEQMCEFMSEHGIAGSCTPMRGVSYRFVGMVHAK